MSDYVPVVKFRPHLWQEVSVKYVVIWHTYTRVQTHAGIHTRHTMFSIIKHFTAKQSHHLNDDDDDGVGMEKRRGCADVRKGDRSWPCPAFPDDGAASPGHLPQPARKNGPGDFTYCTFRSASLSEDYRAPCETPRIVPEGSLSSSVHWNIAGQIDANKLVSIPLFPSCRNYFFVFAISQLHRLHTLYALL